MKDNNDAAFLASILNLYWAMWNDAYDAGDDESAAKLLGDIAIIQKLLDGMVVTFNVIN